MNYENYFIELFEKPIELAKKLQLTKNDLLSLDITVEGYDLEQLTELIINRYRKQDDTTYEWKDGILWIDCPYENEDFKANMIRFLSNFPKFELKFCNQWM